MMKIRFYVLLFLVALLSLNTSWVIGQGFPVTGRVYERLEFEFEVERTAYANPFDPNDIDVSAEFTSPRGRDVQVPGFWMQPYDVDSGTEDGDPVWLVRFAPDEVGEWSYNIQALNDGGDVVNEVSGEFEISASDVTGFVEAAPNGRYFQYRDGGSFFPIGHNLKWEPNGDLNVYLDWLQSLAESGGNYARVYVDVPWFMSLESSAPVGDYRQGQQQAAQFDAILEAAEDHGIYLQVVLVPHRAFQVYNGAPVVVPDAENRPDLTYDWAENPYNANNGGPTNGVGAFFYDPATQNFLRQRFRYIIARWGYSPNIFAWELVDEIEQVAQFDPVVANRWLVSMADYVRKVDQKRHMITVGNRDYVQEIAESTAVDFVSSELYQSRPVQPAGDQMSDVRRLIQRRLAAAESPVLLTAYSLNPWFAPIEDDPTGVHFQNALWTAVMTGAAGGAMSDWWDTYVIAQDLQKYYLPLAAFVSGVDWVGLNMQPAEASVVLEDPDTYTPIVIDGFNRQFQMPPPESIESHVITTYGIFPSISNVPGYLYGTVVNNRFHQPQLYRFAVPVDTYLTLRIRAVSEQQRAQLVVKLDGASVLELDLPPDSEGVTVRIPLPAGEHDMELGNMGPDWLNLASMEIEKFGVPLRVLSLADKDAGVLLAWLMHENYTWQRVADNFPRAGYAVQYRMGGMLPGEYRVEIWNPVTGVALGDVSVVVADSGVLQVDLPPVNSQLALRAFRFSN